MQRTREYMTIGEVVRTLEVDYPGLTVSKLRFLEEEGLVSPERTPGGYRKFTTSDLARIETILKLQKDHFLPLSVIRERMRDLDRGRTPEELRSPAVPTGPDEASVAELETVKVEDTSSELGLPRDFMDELVEYGLVTPVIDDGNVELTRVDIEIAHACWDLKRFGLEPRHLRMFEGFAERESTLLTQALRPTTMHRTPEIRQKAAETLGELARLTDELKRQLLRRALGESFEGLA
jgi:DNA-binding transcriptional MerR regulator